jgi:hypothetical protein
MKNIFKRAHEMAKEIKKEYPEVDYRAQFGLCLSYLLNNKEELEMIQRYQEYLDKFGLAYTEPMSYEDFVEHCKKEDAREAEREKAIANALPAAEANYAHYIEQAAQADEDEAREIVRRMKEHHDSICQELLVKGEREAIGAEVQAYNEARRTILAPYKRRRRPARHFIATNVYDDDDRPTTHKFGL